MSDQEKPTDGRVLTWQPIETAPRDGTWIRLRGGTIPSCWDGDSTPPEVVGQYVGGVDEDGVPCWQFGWYDGGFYGTYEKPTHWIRTTPWQPKEEDTTSADSEPGQPLAVPLSEGLGAWDEDARRLLRLVTRLGIDEIAGIDLHAAAAKEAARGGLSGVSPECYLHVIRAALDATVSPAEWRRELTYGRA